MVFASDRLALASRYADMLAGDGVVRGLIGPRETPRLWERHLLNCAALAEVIPQDAEVGDIGSGAGLPGIVLALARPDLRVDLVEPLLRRTRFLDAVVADLGLDTVTVRRARAEDLHGERRYDLVTARAVAPMERLLGWCMPLVAPEGALVAMKGSSAAAEIEAAGPALDRLGCSPPEVLELGAGLTESTTSAVRVTWADPGTVSWPIGARSGRAQSGRKRQQGRSRSAERRRRV